ncbi:MAG: rod shape-determining protein MreD [Candidatus Latescibacterota bacterium]|nr:MAG: rod shape-determining protein MreD [Candidatus Latescibacterota bacterium]RKY66464.1 MAG: rod shape-determining protein MreD [Candidatus Latescibacterota bacterium]RKY74751.1 MAG: rod shape-determining protein MreD [Candidatus Latescibacterota bacterium]HDH99534.1 rod shape-determining protein MreD [Bacillota bacterium]
MGYLRDLLLMVCALLLQSTFGPKLRIGWVVPDFVVLSVLCGALSRGEVWGTSLGFLGGFFLDIYSPDLFGLNAFSLSIVGFVGGRGRGRVGTEYLLVQAGACVAAVLLHDGIYIFFLEKGNMLGWLSRMVVEALPTALYTAAVGVGISAARSLALGRRLIYA